MKFCIKLRAVSIAITRKPSPAITQCELTYVDRAPIDFKAALLEHDRYELLLKELGLTVQSLPALNDSPDCVFVEDPAVVFDEFALINRMGTPAREHETSSLVSVLSAYRELKYLQGSATLEGGDVLKNGKTIYVGLSPRTNAAGIEQLAALAKPFGYEVIPVTLQKCLHLKTACTFLNEHTLLANPDWVDLSSFKKTAFLTVDPREPFSANTLSIDGKTVHSAGFSHLPKILEKAGFSSIQLDISELAKAEAGLTCLSLIF